MKPLFKFVDEIRIDIYNEEKDCWYQGEHYLVRDNGAVLRLPKDKNKIRKLDNVWTFGTPVGGGYLGIAGVRIHRIVATAFHGEAPGPDYVVDHYDTKTTNNEPSNLSWVTPLENMILNPRTRRKLESIFHMSIFDLLTNHVDLLRKLNKRRLDQNEWIERVTKEDVTNAILKYCLKLGVEYESLLENNIASFDQIYGTCLLMRNNMSLNDYQMNMIKDKSFFLWNDNGKRHIYKIVDSYYKNDCLYVLSHNDKLDRDKFLFTRVCYDKNDKIVHHHKLFENLLSAWAMYAASVKQICLEANKLSATN